MVYSDTSSKNGILQLAELYCGFSDGGITGDSVLIKQFTGLVNARYDRVVSLILKSDGRWKWDDSNQSTEPYITANLVANTQSYAFNVAYLKLSRVEIKDSSGNWIQLKRFEEDDLEGTALPEFQETAGTPKYYRVMGNKVYLYPKPDYSSANGMAFYVQRNAVAFISTDTTKEAGFASLFHNLLPLGASYDFCISNGLFSRLNYLKKEIMEMENSLVEFYSSRDTDQKVRLRARKEDYGDNDYGAEQSVNW